VRRRRAVGGVLDSQPHDAEGGVVCEFIGECWGDDAGGAAGSASVEG